MILTILLYCQKHKLTGKFFKLSKRSSDSHNKMEYRFNLELSNAGFIHLDIEPRWMGWHLQVQDSSVRLWLSRKVHSLCDHENLEWCQKGLRSSWPHVGKGKTKNHISFTVHFCHCLCFLFKILRGNIQVFTVMKMRFVRGQWPHYNVPNSHFKRLIFLRTHRKWFWAHELHRFSQKTHNNSQQDCSSLCLKYLTRICL